MILSFTIIFFVFGLIIGSFFNVVIFRFNTSKSLGGRSVCLSCEKTLCWYDLLPFISFFALGGRCRNCKSKISIQYPLVELFTGLLFSGLFWKFQSFLFADTLNFSLTFAYYAIMFSFLLVIAVYDLKHKIIPDRLSLILGIFAFVGMFLFSSSGFNPHIPSIMDLLSGILIALPFAAMWFFSKGTWMGLGDAKLAIGIGWMLGFSRILSGVVVAFWSGAIIGVLLLFFSKKHSIKSEIPFAPFLVLGTIIAFLFEIHLFPISY